MLNKCDPDEHENIPEKRVKGGVVYRCKWCQTALIKEEV